MNIADFTKKYYADIKQATRGTGIFPEVALAQMYFESGKGESKLSKDYNKFFGVKCGSNWQGKCVTMDTSEGGIPYKIPQKFRVYSNPYKSIRNYVEVLQNPRYASALKQNNANSQIAEIKKGGYATDPNYVSKIQSVFPSIQTAIAGIETKKTGLGKVISLSAIGIGLMGILFYFYKKSRK